MSVVALPIVSLGVHYFDAVASLTETVPKNLISPNRTEPAVAPVHLYFWYAGLLDSNVKAFHPS